MKFFERLKMRFQSRMIKWAVGSDISPQGAYVRAQGGEINDGIHYDMPIVLPGYLQEALEKRGKLKDYLTEAATDTATYHFQFDTPYRSAADLPINPTTEDPLKEWNWSTRRMVLSTCHSVYARNPLANTAIQYTADFVIGEGFNLTCKNQKVQEFLDEFISNPDNAIREYERQAVIDLQVDGELFLRYFEQDGQVVAVPMRPWECQWIKTEKGFFRRPETYYFQYFSTEGDAPSGGQSTETDDIPAKEIQHVAINRHAYELRGKPELYRILPWLRADAQFLENTARQHHWRNALLWFVQVAKATPAVLASVVARYSRPPTPGSIAVETDNVNLTALTNPASSSAAAEDGRQIRLKSIVGMRMAEYMFADGENANLATATAQQLPALTKFSAFQTIMVEQVWTPMFRRVLQTAIDAGLLPEECEEQDADGDTRYEDDGTTACMCDTVKCFSVTYSPLKVESQYTLVQALALAKEQGWVDDETAIGEIGFDPDIIMKRLKAQHEQDEAEQEEKMKAGMIPPRPGMRPEAMTDDEEDDAEQGGDAEEELPANQPTAA